LELVNRELESFSYSVSHDLRAPLRYINGFVDLLIKQYGSSLDEKGKHYLAVINQSSAQMGELIDDLLIFSRMGKTAISVTQVDMRAVVDEVIMNFNAEINSRSIVWTIENLPTVNADQSMMKLVFQNLIGNAIKYSRPKKEAIITIQHKKTDTEHTFSVSDNGVGFDMQYYEKLFGVFQRLHRNEEFEGTGIGLANVQRIISRHGGKVWAKSQPDKETSFYFTLPHIIVKENQ
jgi:light-regulated signal transduction histidine kinase (bacteriophytochrome)